MLPLKIWPMPGRPPLFGRRPLTPQRFAPADWSVEMGLIPESSGEKPPNPRLKIIISLKTAILQVSRSA